MEYCIAGDDGSAGIWNRPFDVDLDGDGRLDAIGLDLDGDGLRDDALADFDGDDVADHAVFDVDNDGTPESYFIDDGSGTWAVAVDRGGQLRWYGLDGVEHTGGPLVDFDGSHERAQLLVGRGDVGCRWAGGAVAGAAAERLCRRGCAAVGGRWRRWRPEGLGVGGPVYRDDLAERGFDKATCGGCGVAQRGHAVRAD